MTTSSTETFLQVCNQILLMAGERPVTNLTSTPVARKVASVVREAVLEVSLLDDWSFTRQRITAPSWVANRAELDETVQRIVSVNYKKRPLHYVSRYEFDLVETAYSGFWTMDGYNAVLVSPAPVDTLDATNFTFDVIAALVPPNEEDDPFPVPDRFLPLITKRSMYLFVLRHLDDAGLAAQYNNEFELMVQLIRNRERYIPRGSANMYRGRR